MNKKCEIKSCIKYFLGFMKCRLYHIRTHGEVYIGKNVHVANGRNFQIGKNVQIRPDVDLFVGEKMIIGDGCDIGTRNRICGNVIIENDVLLGPDNYICSTDHSFEDIELPIIKQGVHKVRKNGHDEMRIGAGCWIGTHVAIIGDVHIGKHCVVGANSVVTKDIPDFSVVAGAPAKIKKKYNIEKGKWERV